MIMATSLLLGACNPATDVNVKETGDKNLIGKSDIQKSGVYGGVL